MKVAYHQKLHQQQDQRRQEPKQKKKVGFATAGEHFGVVVNEPEAEVDDVVSELVDELAGADLVVVAGSPAGAAFALDLAILVIADHR